MAKCDRREPVRRCVPVAEWPAIDRQIWEAAFSVASSLDGPALREKFRLSTIRKMEAGYGRFINFCRQADISESGDPADRVTRETVVAFWRHLRDLGNSDFTLVARLNELRSALKILCPEKDFRWITSPAGTSIQACLPMIRKAQVTSDQRMVFQAGLRLAHEAIETSSPARRPVIVRDGLMMSLVASRGMRLRSLVGMALGRNLRRVGDTYRVYFAGEEVKTGQPMEYGVPPDLTWLIDRYLAVDRVELLDGRSSDWLWISAEGSQLSYHAAGVRMEKRSIKLFGERFRFHRLRHGIASSAVIGDPGSTGVAASVLGITEQILTRHYDCGASTQASRAMIETLGRARDNTRLRADRVYGRLEKRRPR